MTLKVANIIEDGRLGGPQIKILEVAQRLKRYNIETTVFLPKDNSDFFYSRLNTLNIKNRRLRLHRLTRNKTDLLRYIFFFLTEILILRKNLKSGSFDIVHCNGAWQIKGIIAGKLAGAEIIWYLNDTRKSVMMRQLFRTMAHLCCDGLILAGTRVKSYYCSDSIQKKIPHFVLQGLVDTNYFSPVPISKPNGSKPNKRLTIITVANINPAKGLEHFIKMASLLKNVGIKLKFIIIGNAFGSQIGYFDRLSALVKTYKVDNLVFKQGIYDVRPFLQKADIYVCSSIHEASPLSLWEAMSMSKPIVTTDVGDVAEFIKDGDNGFVVAPGNAEALAVKVELLVKNNEIRNDFTRKIRKVAVDHLDSDIYAKKYVQAYQFVLNG